jgi:transcriptional/translational regulatory protein YebC/TACO1
VNEDGYEITTSPNAFLSVKEGLEKLGYNQYIMSEVTYIPDNYMSLDEEATEKAVALIETLEDLDDVQAVYHNLEL